MDIEFLTEARASKALIMLISRCRHVDMAVAWAGQNSVVDAMLDHHEKLRHVVVGTHLYQTDPRVLREFMKVESARCMPPDGRLFHPKVYLFELAEGSAAIVGSHNLTGGAFDGANVEASILLRGPSNDPIFQRLSSFVKKSWIAAEDILEETFLFAYEAQYRVNQERRRALERFHRLKKPRTGTSRRSPLGLDWGGFVAGVKSDKHHSLDGRINILERAASMFRGGRAFGRMSRDERRAIAGTFGRAEDSLDNLDWGWFGSMIGQGDFKNLVNESPEGLSKALDCIPLKGDVEESDFRDFVAAFEASFEDKAHRGGVATGSRLLTMKRPDIFAGVNKANRQGLCDAVGAAPTTLNLHNYWERIVVPAPQGCAGRENLGQPGGPARLHLLRPTRDPVGSAPRLR